MKNKLKLIIFILLTPGIIIGVSSVPLLISEYQNSGNFLKRNLNGFLNGDNLNKLLEVRWNSFSPEREDFISKLVYNKGYILLDNTFSLLSFTSPRLFFQAGDGTKFSPQGVEPIAGLMFPFWIFGILRLIKSKNFKPLVLVFVFSLFAFIFGQRNFAYLFPILIVYVIIALGEIKGKYKGLLFLYSLFLIGRMIWLRN